MFRVLCLQLQQHCRFYCTAIRLLVHVVYTISEDLAYRTNGFYNPYQTHYVSCSIGHRVAISVSQTSLNL